MSLPGLRTSLTTYGRIDLWPRLLTLSDFGQYLRMDWSEPMFGALGEEFRDVLPSKMSKIC